MFRQTSPTRRPWLPALALFCLALPASAADDSGGWGQMEHNRMSAARTTFAAALKQNPADADALRGLALAREAEDQEGGALDAWRRFYHAAPAHWSAPACWPRFAEMAQGAGRWDLLEGAARDVLAAPGATPGLRASARLALAEAAARAGRQPEAERQWSALGYVRRWQVVGPFDNASQSGLDKVYAPERPAASAPTYEGKDGQTLHWHRLALVGRDGQCAVGSSLSDGEPDVFYAETAVQSGREQAARLAFDPTGASKVLVNGRAVFSDPIRRAHVLLQADPFVVPVTLRAGWNTILIKLGDDEKLTSAFALRVTTPEGEALAGLTADPSKAGGNPGIGAEAAPEPPVPAELARLRLRPSGTETSALLGDVLRRARDYPASEDVLRQAVAASPDCGWLRWELAQTLRQDGQDDEARTERDLALKENPHLVEAALEAVEDAEEAVSPAELVGRARAVLALNPSSPDALWALSRAYGKAKLNGDALKAARQATALAPGSGVRLHLAHLYDNQDRKAEAAACLAEALGAAPGDVSLLDAQATLLSDKDSDAAALAVYERLVVLDPADPSYRPAAAKLLEGLRRTAEAVRTLRLARSDKPQDADVCASLADLLQEGGQKAEAAGLYREAIRLDPSQISLRDKLAVLSGEKPVLDLVPPSDGAAILAGAKARKPEPGASAVLLLDEGRAVVYPDYASLVRYHQIIQILDKSAVDRYQEYGLARQTSTADATVESARLLKADGKVQDVTDAAGRSSIPFPSLAIGDTIDVTYRIEDYHRGGLAHQFWEQWSFDSLNAPSRLSRYVLVTPAAMTFATKDHGAVPAPSVREAGAWRIREWRVADVPARRSQVMGVGGTDAGTWLDVSTVPSWADVVGWYQDLSRPRCVPDAAIRAKAAELTKGAATEEDKIRAIQAFVAQSIQYQSGQFRLSAYVPTEGKQVLRERYGDCKDKAALLTALLGAVGIHSDMVLLSGRSHGLTSYLPSPRFNHAIARVQTAQGPLWVDATADHLGYGALPPDDQQVPSLVIADGTTELTETPLLPPNRDLSVQTYDGTLDDKGVLHGSLAWSLVGSLAWQLRSVWSEVPEARNDEMMRKMAEALVKDGSYEGGGLERLSEINAPLGLNLKYHVDRFSTPAGSFLLIPLFWDVRDRDKTTEALLSDPARTQDVEAAGARGVTRCTCRLTLPPGYVPQELPAEAHQDTPFGSTRFTCRLNGNVLEAMREVTFTSTRVPLKDIPKYVAFLQASDADGERQVVLKKP